MAALMQRMAEEMGEEGGEEGGEAVEIELTQAEAAAVDRLMGLGFPRDACVEAFIICDKNEEAAANYLLDPPVDMM
jgi:UV excision repair protein RAD23